MNASPASIPKRRLFSLWFLSRCLFFLVCVVTLIALFYAEEDLRGKFIWNHYRNKMEALGEKFNELDFVPSPVPDDKNFAMAPFFEDARLIFEHRKVPPEDASRLDHLRLHVYRDDSFKPEHQPALCVWFQPTNTDLATWQQYYRYRKPADASHKRPGTQRQIKDCEFPVSPQPQTPAQDVLLALGTEDDALQKLREASLRPESRFPIDYSAGNNALLPHLSKLISAGLYLQLLSTAQLAARETNQAAANVDLVLYLQNSIQSEPFLISHLVRLSIENIALNIVWEGMEQHRWSDEQLRVFEGKLQAQNLLADFQHAVRGERAMNCDELDLLGDQSMIGLMRNHIFQPDFGQPALNDSQNLYLRLAPRGWFHEMKRDYASLIQDTTLAAVQPGTQRVDIKLADSFHGDARAGTYTENDFVLNKLLSSRGTEDLDCKETVLGQTGLHLGILACALERYWLANGIYPDHLEDLVPRFINQIPHEIATGQPLRYRRTPNDHFKVYSTGCSDRDFGGVYGTFVFEGNDNLIWAFPEK